ncbi:DNA polymerase, partial [Citrobacter sp. TBCS-11]
RNIDATQDTHVLQFEALTLFRERYKAGAVRQIGISGNQLSDENIKQLSLFETINEDENKQTEKQEALQKA